MQTTDFEEGISLQELFQSVFSRFYIVILFLILSVVASSVYLHFAVKKYETTITMIVEPITKTSTFDKILSDNFFNSDNDIATEIHLITNITDLEAAANRLDLSTYLNSKGIPYSEPSALGSLKSKTSINNFKDTNIVELTITDENPEFAADFANAIALNFNEMLSTYGKDSKIAQIAFLQEQIPATEQQLDDANDKLFDYKANTGIDFLSNNAAALVNHISYLQMRKKPLQLQIVKSEALLKGFQAVYENKLPFFDVYDNDKGIQGILKIYGMAFNELIQYDVVSNNDYRNTISLSVANSSVNERITKLNSQMTESRKQLMKRVRAIVKEAGIVQYNENYEAYYRNIDNYCFTVIEKICNEVDVVYITEAIETFEQDFNQLPILEKDLSKLQSDVDSLEAIRRELNSLLEQITLSATAQNNNVKLVTAAEIPIHPVSPNVLLILAVSILLGGALGVLLCLFLQMQDDRIHSLEDIKKIAGSDIPLLGWTPLIDRKRNTDKNRYMHAYYKNPESYISERYKAIVSNLLYGKNSDKKVFLITSSNISEGKSNLTCNIALYLAPLGYRILIIDGDLKNHSIGKFFGLKYDLAGYVEQIQKGEALENITITPIQELENLNVLVPGKTTVIPSVFYSRTNYMTQFDSVRNNYDYVFIDAPPLEYASGLMGLLKKVDGVILCVRLSICSRTNLTNLIGQVKEKTNKIAGIIATGCALAMIEPYTNTYNYSHHDYFHNEKPGKGNKDFIYVKSERKAIRIFKRDIKKKRQSYD